MLDFGFCLEPSSRLYREFSINFIPAGTNYLGIYADDLLKNVEQFCRFPTTCMFYRPVIFFNQIVPVVKMYLCIIFALPKIQETTAKIGAFISKLSRLPR